MSTTNPLVSYLDSTLIEVSTHIRSRKALLESMSKLLSKSVIGSPNKQIYHSLLEREKLGNTGIGNGIALPHSRFEHVEQPIIAIITLENAIDYHSLDNQSVNIAFGLLVPIEAQKQHLDLLADIARFLSEQKNRVNLLAAKSPQQIIKIIHFWAERNTKK